MPALTSPVRELLDARELLRNLTIRELKVRYKRSALGFAWTLLNPLLMMAVFTAVFSTFFKGMLGWFPIYFLSGYLPFAFFQASATVATGSIVANANLVRKVYFPRSVLPVSVVLAQLVHLLLGLGVLLVAETIIWIGWDRSFHWWWFMPLLLVAIALLTIFTTGLAMLLAAANTFLRDIQEFTTVAFLMWFYATPVIYPLDQLPGWVQTIIKLNPMTHFVELFRDALYSTSLPTWSTVLAATGSAFAMFTVGWLTFNRLSREFAKEV